MIRTVDTAPKATVLRFGLFELDADAGLLRRNGRTVRLQPQPFKLLCLLTQSGGRLVTREEIQAALWTGDTFVDFEQGVNFAVKQVRDALGEDAEHPLYIQTVPKRGYRFVAPIDSGMPGIPPAAFKPTDLNLHKAMWANIVELRLEEGRRKKRQVVIAAALVVMAVAAAVLFLVRGS